MLCLRFSLQFSRLFCWLVWGTLSPGMFVQLSTVVRGVRPRSEPITQAPCSHREHSELHQWRCWECSCIQGTRRECVHQPTGHYYSRGAAAEPSGGTCMQPFYLSLLLQMLSNDYAFMIVLCVSIVASGSPSSDCGVDFWDGGKKQPSRLWRWRWSWTHKPQFSLCLSANISQTAVPVGMFRPGCRQ